MDNRPSTITRPNQITTWKHFTSYKLSSSCCIWASPGSRERSLTHLQILIAKNKDKRINITAQHNIIQFTKLRLKCSFCLYIHGGNEYWSKRQRGGGGCCRRCLVEENKVTKGQGDLPVWICTSQNYMVITLHTIIIKFGEREIWIRLL